MTRSRKKTPAGGFTTAASEQSDKTAAARALRRKVRTALQAGEEEMPHRTAASNPWTWAKDGKTRWNADVVGRYPKLLRK